MNVFVAGATGAIGRRLVPLLVKQGHHVTAIGRSSERLTRVEGAGIDTMVCDVLDAGAVARAVSTSAPEVVIDELTDLPAALKPRGLRSAYERNNRVRYEGGRNLLNAAEAAGVHRLILQSSAFWYVPRGPEPKAEDAPFFVEAREPVGKAVRTMKAVEERAQASSLEVSILRYGLFYGPGTWYWHDGDVGRQVKARMFPMIGNGAGVFSFVHIDDAAAATANAVTGPAGIYNVVDDDPAQMAEWLPAFASALEARPPLKVPVPLARLAAGSGAVEWMTTVTGADNARAKAELRWAPAHPTWRTGFRWNR